MKALRFYEHFACGYGTLWLLMLLVALLTQSHIDAGEFGLFGFPAIAFVYALIRALAGPPTSRVEEELAELRRRINDLHNRPPQGSTA